MKSFAENLYLKSPIFFQNVVLSIYGYYLNRERFGKQYRSFVEDVKRRENSTQKEIETYVDAEVHKTVINAAKYVPFYRRLFRNHGIDPHEIHVAQNLSCIPLLNKMQIRRNTREFLNECFCASKLKVIHTTGTTGTPLLVYYNEIVRQSNYAFYDCFLAGNGIQHRGKRATFGGRIVVPMQQTKPPFWRYSKFQNNLLLSSYHLNERNIPAYIEKLRRFRPDFIDTYPSSLYAIVDFARKHSVDLKGITDSITTSAETLYPDQRAAIQESFGVNIYDQYGAAEMCVFVGQCRMGAYHVRTDYAWLEIIRQDGSPAPPGEDGEIVCTSFINPVMPLIRYRIGDRGVLSKSGCNCGSPFPVLERLLGRMDDVVITPDGRKIGRLSPVLKGFPVKEAQYVQNNIHELEIHIIRGKGYNIDSENALDAEIRKRVGMQIGLKFKYVDHIKRGSGGKFRSVVSNIAQK